MIVGTIGVNIIDGERGNDILTGGQGADTFVFNTALSAAANVDWITDFSAPLDTIQLENAVFTALAGVNTLSAGQFHIGAAAADANDHIIYNSATGNVFYDSNGAAAGGATQFAKLAVGLHLTAADFFII